jgi:hypothetical protein
MSETNIDIEGCSSEGPQSALERKLVEEYLQGKGYSKEDLLKLPKDKAKELMVEACTYASLKLAELEAKSHFRENIRAPS